MNVPDDPLRREIALFRYRIIADLLLLLYPKVSR